MCTTAEKKTFAIELERKEEQELQMSCQKAFSSKVIVRTQTHAH